METPKLSAVPTTVTTTLAVVPLAKLAVQNCTHVPPDCEASALFVAVIPPTVTAVGLLERLSLLNTTTITVLSVAGVPMFIAENVWLPEDALIVLVS